MKTKKLLATLAIVSVVLITGCRKDEYKGLPLGKCPAVDRTIPTKDAVNVPLKQIISATFNKKGMNGETITKTSFTVQQGATAIAGTKSAMVAIEGEVTYNDGDSTATFKPDNDLIPYTIYEGRVKSSVKDLLGNALRTDYVWSFTTIPQVKVSSNPIAGGSAIIMDNLREGTFDQGSSVTVTATPNPGYAFSNWTDTDKGTIASTSSTYIFPLNTNTNLVANFANTYTLTIIAANGDVVKTPDLATYNQGTTVTLTATPHLGYTFTNWTGDDTGFLNPFTVTMDKNKIITANFSINVYALNIKAPNGSYTKTPDQATYNHGTVVPLTATPNPNYHFVNWTEDAEDGNVISTVPNFSVTMTGTRNLFANFAINAKAPTVNSTSPADGDKCVVPDKTVSAIFSEPMDPSNPKTSFTLKQTLTSTPVDGEVTYSGTTASFNPSVNLLPNTQYTATITTGAKSLAGIPLAADKVWTFNTGCNPIVTLSSSPAAGGTTVGAGSYSSGTSVTVTASKNPLYNFVNWTDKENGTEVSTSPSYQFTMPGNNRYLVANFSLIPVTHAVTLSSNPPAAGGTTGGAGAYSAGVSVTVTAATTNPLYKFDNWTDKENGTEVSTSPSYQFTMPDKDRALVANFTAIAAGTYTLIVTHVNGSVLQNPFKVVYNSGDIVTLTATPNTDYAFSSWSGDATGSSSTTTVTMNSDKNVTANFIVKLPSTFTLNVTTAHGTVTKDPDLVFYPSGSNVTLTPRANPDYKFDSWGGDASGNADPLTVIMNSDKNITANFTLIPIVPLGPGAVDLGAASNFVILSKAGITDVPTSSVTGDVGTSPISGAYNGLTCTEVTGKIYSVTAAGPAPCSLEDPIRLTAAVSAMELAYTDAAGRPTPDHTELGTGNISGMNLAPGLYKWGTNVIIPSDVTLTGGPEDTWIFQISQDLIVSNAVIVHLAGGAQAKNIFWQVEGLVTLGTTSQFEGIILCMTAINMRTGASINGRLFAQTEVTLQSNSVTKP